MFRTVGLVGGSRTETGHAGNGSRAYRAETKGRVGRSDETTLFLDKGRTIARDSIARVYLTKRGSILKGALIGAAAGAGIGVAIGIGVTVATKTNGLAAAGGFLIGIPVGAAVGAATTGRKRGRLIYESP